MSAQNLQQKLIELKKEVMTLKQFASLSPLLFAYTVTINNPLPQKLGDYNTFRVTYAEGKNDILSTFLSTGYAWAEAPVGNTQIVHSPVFVVGRSVTVYSTRPILKIEQIS